ncbi:MAG: DUF4124 domain-containing protein [Gammaproteobacteria bacterium]
MTRPHTLLLLLLLGSSCTAFAQVYQSTDSEGNTSFSDTPSAGSQEIIIPETNTGDAVKVPEPNPEPEPAPEPKVVEQQAAPTEAVEGDDNSGGGYYNRRHHRRHRHGR